jgi:hypothetical protein
MNKVKLPPNFGKVGSSLDIDGALSVVALRKALQHTEANLREAVRRKRVKDGIIRELRLELKATKAKLRSKGRGK